MMEKPPLGLRPEYIWLIARQQEIEEAIDRYKEAGWPVPEEWYEELVRIAELAISATLRFHKYIDDHGETTADVTKRLCSDPSSEIARIIISQDKSS